MSVEDFGLFNTFAAWQLIFVTLFGLEGFASLNRARFDYQGIDLYRYQFSILTLGLIMAIGAGLVAVLVPNVLFPITHLPKEYIVFAIVYSALYPPFFMYLTLQRITYKYRAATLIAVGLSLLTTFLSLALTVGLPDALEGRVLGQYAPFIIAGLCIYIWYGFKSRRLSLNQMKYALKLCLPLTLAAFGNIFLQMGGRLVAQAMGSSAEVAYIALATTCSGIVMFLVAALNNAWSPWLMERLDEGDAASVRDRFRIYLTGTVILIIFVSLLSPELVAILGGDGYEPTVELIPSFMIGCFFSMVASQYIYLETYCKSVSHGGWFTLVAGVLNLVLSALFLRMWGFESLGYANALSYLSLLIAHKWIIGRLGLDDVFLGKGSGRSFCLLIVIPIISIFLFRSGLRWLRYAAIAAVSAFAVMVIIRRVVK